MPSPKRWHPVSRDLNDDPDVWEFTEAFGDRAIRTLLEVLAIIDKTDNAWRWSSQSLASISRKTRQKLATVQREIDWMLAKGWLVVTEQAADGSPAVMSTRNFLKFHRTREPKGGASGSEMKTYDRAMQAPSYPNLPYPNLREEKKEGERMPVCTSQTRMGGKELPQGIEDAFDAVWQIYPARMGKRLGRPEALKKFLAMSADDRALLLVAVRHYAASELARKGIGVRDFHRFIQNGQGNQPWREWISPEESTTGHGAPLTCTKRVHRDGSSFLAPCGQPASPESRATELRCAEHLKPSIELVTCATH